MSQLNGDGPLTDRPELAPSSPARQALRGKLDAAGDADLSLKKKRSWFGSLRDAVHKGALQAKTAVDTFRGDQHKNEM